MIFTRLRLLLVLAAVLGSAQAVGATLPNIVFFLSDDHRSDMLGCAGHEIVKTPHIDRLAAEGVRFENAFVTTSICAASRATILTGLWERTHRFTFGTPPLAERWIDDSYPVRLRAAGYRTGFVGKFGMNVSRHDWKRLWDWSAAQNRTPYLKKQPDGSLRHLTDLNGDRAIEFLNTCRAEEPFCLSVSFSAAHAEDGDRENHFPWPSSEEGLYEDVVIPPPRVRTDFWKELPGFFHKSMNRNRYFWRWDTPEKYQRNAKAYYRMITGLDRNVGRVLAELERRGWLDNTIVIFTGDNGYYKGSRGFAGKWTHYEESLRVPLVVFDPRLPKAKRGQVVESLALNVDLAPTMLAAANVEVPASHQGRDLGPLVRGESADDWRDDFFCEHLFDYATVLKWEGVRGQRYVYARYFEHLPEGEFLHDLEADPLELTNLVGSAEHSEVLERMRARCDELRDRYGGEFRRPRSPTDE
ncbi:MAG: DUF4976 domain-containing protein [Planctomycetota bacterium]|nr:MAG: DUF4976 domain-containing protein [Planctomycetota bacterium]REJ94520.1 MAG: DUF4976 domain-containing protein [Planctomycetota bacterium]REK18618.1 MAG: DUF4976 domain-containing protein [Planctomycetota bacterium]REK37514.1 MAG: DUF4976 domain-containing protein [Planctomycetota bacterium]